MNKPVVLLIDDDPDDREFFRLAVSGMPVQIQLEFADNAVQGFHRLMMREPVRPDFIFVDLNMPLMNGVNFLREIRRMEKLCNIPVYIWSASNYPLVVETCQSLGAAGFINKFTNVALIRDSLYGILCGQQVVRG